MKRLLRPALRWQSNPESDAMSALRTVISFVRETL